MNIPIIDLHCHSNVSDGLLSPAELMSHAAENNVQAINFYKYTYKNNTIQL